MKLRKGFIVHHSGEESILVSTGDTDFSGVVNGNQTLGLILECLKEDVSEQDIVASLKEKFEADEGAIERDVAKAISELRKIGAIDE